MTGHMLKLGSLRDSAYWRPPREDTPSKNLKIRHTYPAALLPGAVLPQEVLALEPINVIYTTTPVNHSVPFLAGDHASPP